MRELYFATNETLMQDPNPVQLNIERVHISPRYFGWKECLLWNLQCLGKVKAYIVYENEKLIHYSYVTKRCFKFPFLKAEDIEIGPCVTDEAYRGRGIYPEVLRQIVSSELRGGTAYMIISDTNTSSIRGVEKCGFIKTGDKISKTKTKRYLIDK